MMKWMDMFYIEAAWPSDMLQMDILFIPSKDETLRVHQACNFWILGNR